MSGRGIRILVCPMHKGHGYTEKRPCPLCERDARHRNNAIGRFDPLTPWGSFNIRYFERHGAPYRRPRKKKPCKP